MKNASVPVPLLYRFLYRKLRSQCDGNLCISPATARKTIARTVMGFDYDHIMFVFQEFKAYGFVEKIGPMAIQFVEVEWDE
jgi:hypothetical protein